MSKYKRGRKIRSVGDFEKSNCDMFYVHFGKEILKNRAFLINLQYKTLKQTIERGMKEAIKENIEVKPPEGELTREHKLELIKEHFKSYLSEHNLSAEEFLTTYEVWDALGQPPFLPDWLVIDKRKS